jgi:Adenylate and Guanylate cyclase catalytic domain
MSIDDFSKFITQQPQTSIEHCLGHYSEIIINNDIRNHKLVSGNPDTLISDGVFDTGEILVGKTCSISFNNSEKTASISYFCSLHPNERGVVIILSKEESLLSDEQSLQLLESTFVPESSPEFKKMHTSLEKYVDPIVLEQIRDPELVTMQNKILTIVFWDISGFSVLCEKLKSHQELIVEFLREYFSEAALIIRKYEGVLDKFMGDGIMAFLVMRILMLMIMERKVQLVQLKRL